MSGKHDNKKGTPESDTHNGDDAQNVPHRLCTDRIELRRWSVGDAELLRKSLDRSDAHLRRFIPFMKGEPRTLGETRQRLQMICDSFDSREHFQYAIWLRSSEVLLGEVMLIRRGEPGTLELGYWVDVDQTGHGFGREGAAVLTAAGFRYHEIDRLEIRCEKENEASSRLADRLGYRLLDVLVDESTDVYGRPCDLERWLMTRAQFATSAARDVPWLAYGRDGEQLDR